MDDSWRISGEKTFISGGDQDMSQGILHLVFARSAGAGLKGLSLYACPSHSADGSPNAVKVTRIEEKMGLHASPTCQMSFDGADAQLIGAEGAGLQAMFTMMNHARLDVALQGVAHAAHATDLARSYAAERAQGRGADGRPTTVDQHADVSRMIDECGRLTIGCRALCHITLVALARGDRENFVEFMTPVVKYFCTDAGIHAADLAIQVMGGYGYLREYRAEQNWRDARICSIYEGTNAVHARALVTRGLRRNDGKGVTAFVDFLKANGMAQKAKAWLVSVENLLAIDDAAPAAHDFMKQNGGLAFRAVLNRVAASADEARDVARIKRLAS